MELKMKKFLAVTFLSVVSFVIMSCSSTQVQEYANDEEVYLNALKLFNDKDYREAMQLFDMILLQYPASKFADDAQFYISEINFIDEKYILAGFNYQKLIRNYPASDYVKIAFYKSALCNYLLSPTFDRDQRYTYEAIKSFQEFQMLYPGDSLSAEAEKKIMELRNKLANREFFTAELYRKIDSPISSIIYYDEVIKKYPDTKFYEPAFYGKIETLYEIGKYEQLKSLIQLYKSQFPNSSNFAKVVEIEKAITN